MWESSLAARCNVSCRLTDPDRNAAIPLRCASERGTTVDRRVHEGTGSLLRRDAARGRCGGRGLRYPSSVEGRHVRCGWCAGADAEVVLLRQSGRSYRLLGSNVILHDGAKHHHASWLRHVSSCSSPAFTPSRLSRIHDTPDTPGVGRSNDDVPSISTLCP